VPCFAFAVRHSFFPLVLNSIPYTVCSHSVGPGRTTISPPWPSKTDPRRQTTVDRCTAEMVPTRVSGGTLLLGATWGLVHAVAVPDPTPAPAGVQIREPITTPAAIQFDGRNNYPQKRNIVSDIANGVQRIEKSWASVLGTALPSFFTEGTCVGQARLPSLVKQPWC